MKKNKYQRAQSAMEYLLTYSWAILTIAITTTVFLTLSVFDTGSSLGTTCLAQPQFLCKNIEMNLTGVLSINFSQELENNINIIGTACVNGASIPNIFGITNVESYPGQAVNLLFTCPTNGNRIGQSFQGKLWIKYNEGSYTNQVAEIASITTTESTSSTFNLSNYEYVTTPVNFTTYYDLAFSNEPSFSTYNMEPVYVSGSCCTINGAQTSSNNPDKSTVVSNADQVAGTNNALFIGDLESWPVDTRAYTQSQVASNILKFNEIAQWVHQAQPNLPVGFYGVITLGQWSSAWGEVNYVLDTSAYQAWINANKNLQGLANNVSFSAPDLYNDLQVPYNWTQYSLATIQEAHALGKPVYPFVSMYYYSYPQSSTLVPPYIWALNLYLTGRYANGTVLWGGYGSSWNSSSPWWQITQNFIKSNSSTPLPSAPTNLQVSNSNQPHLTWDGPTFSGKNNTGGFVIESSYNGSPFLPVAVVNTTNYIDNYTLSGNYRYYVKSTNWRSDSLRSNIVSIYATRNAFSTIFASSETSCQFCYFFGKYQLWVDRLGGPQGFEVFPSYNNENGYLEYNSVNFGSAGANTITVNVSVPQTYGNINMYVRIDNPNTGQTIGTVILTPTYSSTSPQAFELESNTITNVNGTHDIYLVVPYRTGVTYGINITSLKFGQS